MSETSPLSVGTKAPEFTASASDGTTYRLAELLARGHVALFFYPGNNTPG
jgi:peroxiredoxin